MKYELLSKYFYKGNEAYTNEYKKRTESISCTKLDFQVNSDNVFLSSTLELINLISTIYKKNYELTLKLRTLPGIAKASYQRSCLLDEIILTNEIEGVYSTRREIRDVLISIPEDKSKRFSGLVIKYLLLLEKHPVIPLNNCADIRLLYDQIVLDEVKGENKANIPDGEIFRREISQVVAGTQKIKHTGLFPESKIINAMNQALAIFNNVELPALIRISIFHYLFGYIHPFYDGNGRTSRFISSYALSQELNPLVAYRLSYAIKEKKRDYYRAFDQCNDKKNKGDLTPFVIVFLETIESAVSDLLIKTDESIEKLDFYSKQIKRAFKDPKEELLMNIFFCFIQNALFSNEPLGRNELARILKSSYPTVKATLASLIGDGAPISECREGHNKIVYALDLDEVSDYLQGVILRNSG